MLNPWNGRKGSLAVVTIILCAVSATARATTLPSTATFGGAACAANPGTDAGGRGRPAVTRAVASRGAARPAAQVTRNDRADLTFELRPSADGGVEVTGRTGTLQITKTVQSTGEFVLVLSTDRDTVTISVSGQGTNVTRGRTTVALSRSVASQEQADKVRRLLAESNSVLLFRRAAAALIDADDRSPESLALIMADATVGLLTGDVGAPRRIAQFLARRANANLRPVAMLEDCFYVMEQRMVVAWNDYFECYASVFPAWFYDDLCAWRWVIQVESYWFGFWSCSGLNW